MKVIVIGDISGGGNYHLGDEAMSEVAVSELQKRGADVTIVADRPEISGPLYRVPAVRRFELWRFHDRAAKLARMDKILSAARGEIPVPMEVQETLAAVQEANAVVIAGGGNLNSHMTENHLLERVMLKRIASHLGIPLYVSSQTVGPIVTAEDRVLLRELLEYARVFGARERSTAKLLREIGGSKATVVHTLDDVILMDPAKKVQIRADLELPTRYVVGSFTMHSGSTGLAREDYYRTLAAMMDQIVEKFDADVVLLPHMGKLGVDNSLDRNTDVFGHSRIVAYSRSGRVRALEMMRSCVLAAITQDAYFTISTRYHPVVFGAGLGVPAIGLVTSYYSAVRMRGALENVGMESLAIPFESWHPLFGSHVMDMLTNRRAELDARIQTSSAAQRAYQTRWWDGIVADASGDGEALKDDLVAPSPFEWMEPAEKVSLELARLAQEKTNLQSLRSDIERLEHGKEMANLAAKLEKAQQEILELRSEQVTLRHRMRPPGAALRDWIRNRLR